MECLQARSRAVIESNISLKIMGWIDSMILDSIKRLRLLTIDYYCVFIRIAIQNMCYGTGARQLESL